MLCRRWAYRGSCAGPRHAMMKLRANSVCTFSRLCCARAKKGTIGTPFKKPGLMWKWTSSVPASLTMEHHPRSPSLCSETLRLRRKQQRGGMSTAPRWWASSRMKLTSLRHQMHRSRPGCLCCSARLSRVARSVHTTDKVRLACADTWRMWSKLTSGRV